MSLSIVHFDTKAPFAPCARTMPSPAPSSWFISTVNVPSPLSNAPRPSGMPTIRYGVPSGLSFTLSPADRMAVVVTPFIVRTT